jgi:hypothetical protein
MSRPLHTFEFGTMRMEWLVRRNGAHGRVEEWIDGRLSSTWGSMPRDSLGPFIDERKEELEDALRRYRADSATAPSAQIPSRRRKV